MAITKISYTFVHKLMEDGTLDGFFPDIPELGKFKGENDEVIRKNAEAPLRKYILEHKDNLPKTLTSREYFEKYTKGLHMMTTGVTVYFDEFHDGTKNLKKEVYREFKELLAKKDKDILQIYVDRYYGITPFNETEFDELVLEYYCLVKKEPDAILKILLKYDNDIFTFKHLPSLETLDYLIEVGYGEFAVTNLKRCKEQIETDPNYEHYKDETFLKEVNDRLKKLRKIYKSMF